MENNKQVEEEGVENKEVTLPKGVPPTIYTKRKRVSKKDNTQPLKLERSEESKKGVDIADLYGNWCSNKKNDPLCEEHSYIYDPDSDDSDIGEESRFEEYEYSDSDCENVEK
ncbi:hypothetical protein ACTFIT_011120 [Dictyostelium discoideum]